MSDRSNKKLLMVDIDGVLNPLQPSSDFHLYVLDGFKVYLNQVHGSWIRNLAEETDADLVWCTFWEHRAPEMVAPLVGLPEMPYIKIEAPKISSSLGRMKAYSALKYADGRDFVMLEDEWDAHLYLKDTNGHQVLVDPTFGLTTSHIQQAKNYLLS